MKHKRYWLVLGIVSFILGTMLVLPLYGGKNGLEVVQNYFFAESDKPIVTAADSWKDGDSTEDYGQWITEGNAIDGNDATYARLLEANEGDFLEIHITELTCDKVRVYLSAQTAGGLDDIDIDVWYEGGWHEIIVDALLQDTYYILNVVAGAKEISKARITDTDIGFLDDFRVHIFQFNDTIIPNTEPTQQAQCIWNETTMVNKSLNATQIDLYPTSFNITINDGDADKMNITIMENESGWKVVNQTSGSGLSNGTYSFYNTSWIDTLSTTYYVTFNLTDGTDWTNETFKFTTIANNIPTQSGIVPANGSTGIGVLPDLHVMCSDNDNNDMNATWWSNSSGSWVQFASNETSFSNNTNITQNNANFTDVDATYYWGVNLSDGKGGWNNETYYFSTVASSAQSTITLIAPANNSVNQSFICKLYVDIEDDDGFLNQVSFLNTTSGGNTTLMDIAPCCGKTLLNGTYSYYWEGLTAGYTYSWQVFASDTGNNDNYSANFSFTVRNTNTIPPSVLLINPLNNSINNTWSALLRVLLNGSDADGDILKMSFWNETGEKIGWDYIEPADYDKDFICNSTYDTYATLGGTVDWYVTVWDGNMTNTSDTWQYTIKGADSFNYTPFYLTGDPPEFSYVGNGIDNGQMLLSDPLLLFQFRACAAWMGMHLDNNLTWDTNTEINNMYYHINYDTRNNATGYPVDFYWGTDGDSPGGSSPRFTVWGNATWNNSNYIRSHSVTYPPSAVEYVPIGLSRLYADGIWNVNESGTAWINNTEEFNDFVLEMATGSTPILPIGNPSMDDDSWILFNLPSNATLQSRDTDGDGDSDYNELFVNYTNPFWNNSAPDIIYIYPANESTEIPIQPTLIYASTDPENNSLSINVYENTTGVWVLQQTNTTENYIRWQYSNASSGKTTYYWSVNASDGTAWINETYSFTTEAVARVPTKVFDYWFLCGNTSIRTPTQVFNNWFLCGNTSTRVPTQVFNYWFSCGNTSVRVPTKVFNYWFSCGNTSVRVPTQVFNYWWLCGNLNDTVTITLVEYSPLNIRTNSSEPAWYIYNITTKITPINFWSIVWAYGVNHTETGTHNTSYSLEDPLAVDKLRGYNRNENFTQESKFNLTHGDNTIGRFGEWNTHDMNYGITFVDSGSNWTLVNATEEETEHLFSHISFVDEEEIREEQKDGQELDVTSADFVKVKFNMSDTDWWNDGHYNNTLFILHFFANETNANKPISAYYVNSNYTTGDIASSPYASFIGNIQPDSEYHIGEHNSSYYEIAFSSTEDRFVGTVDMTEEFYIVFTGEGATPKKWWIHYADNNDTHTVDGDSHYHDFNNRTIVELSNNGGNSWVANASTADVYFDFISLNEEDFVEVKLYANDTSGNEAWSSVHSDLIDITNYPPNCPDILSPNASVNYSTNSIINVTYSWIGDPNFDTCWVNISYWNWTTTTRIGYIQNRSITSAEYQANHSFYYNWDTTGVAVDNYTITINVTDPYNLWCNATSEIFNITIPPRSPYQVFNYWFDCGNTSVRSPTKVFDYWWLCGNASARVPTQVFNYWWLCSNTSARVPTQIFNYWWLCGNTSTRTPTRVFNYWWLCGNTSTRTPTQVFDYWFLCGNLTIRTPTRIFNYWFQCGNETIRSPTQVFNYWWLCGNTSARTPTQIFDYWFLCGNTSVRTPTQIFNYWWLCGNTSTRVPTRIFNYWFQCGNGTRSPTQVFDYWWLCGNGTRSPTQVFNYWFQCGNGSILLLLTNEYPINESNIFGLQPTIFFTLTNEGGNMSYELFIGNTDTTADFLVDSDSGLDNGTFHYVNYYNASNFSTTYYWRVHYNDTNNHVNETFSFRPVQSGGGMFSRSSSPVAMGIVGGMLGSMIIGIIWYRKKQERRTR